MIYLHWENNKSVIGEITLIVTFRSSGYHVLAGHAHSFSQEHITLLCTRQNPTEQLTNSNSLSPYCVVNIAVSLPITVPDKDAIIVQHRCKRDEAAMTQAP